MRSLKHVVLTAALGCALWGIGTGAQAGTDLYWSVNVGVPGVAVGVGTVPPVVYATPLYVQPAPVYMQPAPLYVQPMPIYATPYRARPAPVVVIRQPYARAHGWSGQGYPGYGSHRGHR